MKSIFRFLFRLIGFRVGSKSTQIDRNLIMRHGHVYKYKSLSEYPEHTYEIIKDCKLYFPRPSQLNDPAEAKPELYIGDINDPAYRPKVEAWVRRCVASRVPIPTESQIQHELRTLTQEMLEGMVSVSNSDYKAEIESRYRILSFAKSFANRHLWENYADNFNGVSFEFNTDSKFGPCYEVVYSDDARLLDITSVDDFEHMVQTGLIKKTSWRAEDEVRMIFGDPPVDRSQPVLKSQKYHFQSSYLTGLFIGYRVSKEHRKNLLTFAKAHKYRIRCFTVFPVFWGTRVLAIPVLL